MKSKCSINSSFMAEEPVYCCPHCSSATVRAPANRLEMRAVPVTGHQGSPCRVPLQNFAVIPAGWNLKAALAVAIPGSCGSDPPQHRFGKGQIPTHQRNGNTTPAAHPAAGTGLGKGQKIAEIFEFT